MRIFIGLIIIGFIVFSLNARAEQFKSNDSLEKCLKNQSDSLAKVNAKLIKLQAEFDNLNSDYQSNLKFVNYAEENADNRLAWTLGLISVLFSLILFGGGFLTYFTTIQPARDILENFDKQVEQKFIEREKKEINERINLAFEYFKNNEYKINENTKLILENLPYPLKEHNREEILKNVILANIDSSSFISFYRLIEKYFFKENDFVNNQFAKYLLNNNEHLHNGIIKYFSQHHLDSEKLIEILFPAIIKWNETIWVYHRQLCLQKFDKLFIYLEDKKLLHETYSNYIKYKSFAGVNLLI